MKIKPIHLILIFLAILILIFTFRQKQNVSKVNIEKSQIEKNLNEEETYNFSQPPEKTPQIKEETYEERVKKMYELIPPSEIIVE